MSLHQFSKTKWIALTVLLLLPGAGVWAQGTAAGGAQAPVKVAVINIRQAIVTTAEGKQASAELQTQFASQQNDLQNMQKQITDLQNRLSNGARTLSEDEQGRLQRQGEMLTRQFQRKQDDLNEQVNAAQSDILDTIGRKMLDVLDRYARENGFALVLDSSAQGGPVVYQATQIDITDPIVHLYDVAYPLKGGAAGAESKPEPKPAAPKKPAQPAQ